MYQYGNVAMKYRDSQRKRARVTTSGKPSQRPLRQTAKMNRKKKASNRLNTGSTVYSSNMASVENAARMPDRKRTPDPQHATRQKNNERQIRPRTSSISILEKAMYLLSVALIFVVLTGLLMQKALISQIDYEVQSVEQRVTSIQEHNEQLQTEVTTLSSPDRIVDIAQNELGMKTEDQRLTILSESSR